MYLPQRKRKGAPLGQKKLDARPDIAWRAEWFDFLTQVFNAPLASKRRLFGRHSCGHAPHHWQSKTTEAIRRETRIAEVADEDKGSEVLDYDSIYWGRSHWRLLIAFQEEQTVAHDSPD